MVFESATYHVRLTHCAPAGRHNLSAYDHARAAEELIATDYRSCEALVAAVFETGILVRIDTIGATFCGGWCGDTGQS